MRKTGLKKGYAINVFTAVAGIVILTLSLMFPAHVHADSPVAGPTAAGTEVLLCPVCHSELDSYYCDDGVYRYVCWNEEAHDMVPYFPDLSSNSSSTIYHSVTYTLYLTADNPSPSTNSVSVEDWGYHRIGGSTIAEYRSGNVRYVFTGNWLVNGELHPDNDRIQIKADTVIEPVYDAYYTLTYLNANQKSTFKTFEVKGGDTHKIITDYPEKKETSKNTYEFAGWTFSRELIKGNQIISHNMIFYPTYNAVPKTSVVTYMDASGNVYKEETVNRGTSFKLPTTGPEKAATSTTRYEFAGWAVNGVQVDTKSLSTYEDMTITPVYTEYRIEQKVTSAPVSKVTDVPADTTGTDAAEDEVPDDTDDMTASDNNDTDDTSGEPEVSTTPAVTDEPAATDVPGASEASAADSAKQGGAEAGSMDGSDNGTPSATDTEAEELDLDTEGVPLGAIVAGCVGGAAVLTGAGFAIAKAAGAAKAADAAAKAKAVRDIEFETKTVLLAVSDSDLKAELTALLGKKKFMAVKTTNAADSAQIAGTADKIKADLVIIDSLKNETAEAFTERLETICPKGSDYKLVAVSGDSYTSVSEDVFKALKNGGTLAGYTSAGASDNQKLVRLVLPVYKPEISADNTAEFIGGVTDALGIPFVSTVVELFVNGKEINETLASKDIDVSDMATVVGNIASIFGLDTVGSISELINGIDTARDVIKTEDVTEI